MKKLNYIFSLYNFCAVRGIADVEGQLLVVVLDDGLRRVGQRFFLEQGHRTPPESSTGHSRPAKEFERCVSIKFSF